MKTIVIMATYNGKKFLEDQLNSIRNQTLQPDYVVFRDDCSSDGTVQFLKKYIETYKLDNWRIECNNKNLGWRLNFYYLLLDSQKYDAELTFFSDQDDIWNSNKIKEQVQIMEQKPIIEVLSTDYEISVLSPDAVYTLPPKLSSTEFFSQIPKSFKYETIRPGWTFALRSKFVGEVLDNWKSEAETTHDVLFLVLSSLLNTGFNLNISLGIHRRHENNASGSIKNKISIRSTKREHLKDLNYRLSFYCVLYNVLMKRNSKYVTKIERYYNFYLRRVKNIESRSKISAIVQVLKDWQYYDTFYWRFRDMLFILKNDKENEI